MKAATTTKTKSTKSGSKSASKESAASKGSVTFEYFAPEARQVAVAGTFNNWNTGEAVLKKEKSGRWKIELALEPGRYEYRYIVDGSWQNDQRPVACVRNVYGSSNCIIEVPKTA